MRITLIIIFWMGYYLLIGGLCCWYFHRYKKEDFDKQGWLAYLFFYGGRFRLAISGILAIFTAELCLYGTIELV